MQLPVSLGKYELTERLRGGAVELYTAREISSGELASVAIPAQSVQESAKNRFLETTRVMAKSRHEAIARVIKIGEFEARPYSVLEELTGADVSSLGTARERLRAAANIASALSYFESRRVTVGEIRVEDIYMDPDGHAKLIHAGSLASSEPIPSFGTLLEQLFDGVADVPPAGRELAQQCTARDAAHRPRNFGEISQRLRAMLAPQVIRQPRNPGKSLVRLSIWVYGLVLLFTVLAILTWYWYQPRQ